MSKLDLGDRELEDVVGALLEVDETGSLSTERARQLVAIAEKAAGETPEHCGEVVFVNGKLVRCGLDHEHRGRCSFRVPEARADSKEATGNDLGSLDDLLEWVPDPGPIREEILALLAKLPPLAELDEVAALVGQLAALVNAPGG